jgi:hypothetical protein
MCVINMQSFPIRLSVLVFFVLLLSACESANFSKDKRQIAAKDAIRELLPRAARNFDVVSFSEDTLATWGDPTVKRPIRYNLDFTYTDSTGTVQNKNGFAVFAPDGKSLLSAQITNP